MEFVQIMKDWRRMCDTMGEKDEYTACDRCPLQDFGCSAIYETDEEADWAHVESVVAKWAAENPEPQYPTWYEYLIDMYPAAWNMIKDKPIPADIAQKLGIEPKEG